MTPGYPIAMFFHRESEFGAIRVGARADLVLLNADPELDLAGFRNPAGVMAAGRRYDSATLHHLLDDVAERIAAAIAAPH